MGRKRKHKRKRTEAGPTSCPLCESGVLEQGRCSSCGARRVGGQADAAADGRDALFELEARVVRQHERTEPSGEGQPAFELDLQGHALTVATSTETDMLHPPGERPQAMLQPGAPVRVLGRLVERFDAGPDDDYRHAAGQTRQLVAAVVALGDDRKQLMRTAVKQLEQRRRRPPPSLEELGAADRLDRGMTLTLPPDTAKGRERQLRLVCGVARPWSGFGRVLLVMAALFMLGNAVLAAEYGEEGVKLGLRVGMFLPLVPLLVVVLRWRWRTTFEVDRAELRVRRPMRQLWRVPAAQIRQVFVALGPTGNALWLERSDGAQQLLYRDDRPRLEQVKSILVDGLRLFGRSVSDAGDLTRPEHKLPSFRVAPLVGVLALLLSPLSCVLWPGCQLACTGSVLRQALLRAEQCPLVTERLGRDLTWAMGCNQHRGDEKKMSLQITGDRGRGQLFLQYRGAKDDPRFNFVTVTVDGRRIDALRCEYWR